MFRTSVKYFLILISIYISVIVLALAANRILTGKYIEINDEIMLTDDILFEVSDIFINDRLLLSGSVHTDIRNIDKIYIVIYKQNNEKFERYYEAEITETDETVSLYAVINLPGYHINEAIKMTVAIQEGNDIKLSSQKYYLSPEHTRRLLMKEETFESFYKEKSEIY